MSLRSLNDRLTFWVLLSAMVSAALWQVACCDCFGPMITPVLVPGRISYIQGPQGKLRVEDGGNAGTPVIFVHGIGGDLTLWSAQTEFIRHKRRAVAFDLRGHGESQVAANNTYTVEGFADDVLGVADALQIKRFVLVGHSMGGDVICAVAQKAPGRVAGLLFDDPAGDLTRLPQADVDGWLRSFSGPNFDQFRDKWFGEMLAPAQPGVRDKVLFAVRRTPQWVIEGAATSMCRFCPGSALANYKGPMLTIVTPENEKPYSLQNVIPGLAFKEVQGTSHWIHMDKPGDFNGLMDAFLSGIE